MIAYSTTIGALQYNVTVPQGWSPEETPSTSPEPEIWHSPIPEPEPEPEMDGTGVWDTSVEVGTESEDRWGTHAEAGGEAEDGGWGTEAEVEAGGSWNTGAEAENGWGPGAEVGSGLDPSTEAESGLDTIAETEGGWDTIPEADSGWHPSAEAESGIDASAEAGSGWDTFPEEEGGWNAQPEVESGWNAQPEGEVVWDYSTSVTEVSAEPDAEWTGAFASGGSAEPEIIAEVTPENEFTFPENETDIVQFPDAEIHGEGTPENGHPYAEPVPHWDAALREYGAAWEVHVYVSGVLFALIALYTVACIARLSRRHNLLSRGYFITLNLMVLLVGVTRALYFLIDPYNARGVFHPVAAYFLFTTCFPCLTAAFSIQLLALMQTLRMRPTTHKVSKVKVLACIVTLHFTLAISTDVIVGLFAVAKVMVLICQLAFVVWGSVIAVAYVYVFRRLYEAARRRQGMVRQLSRARRVNSTTLGRQGSYFEKPKLTMVVALRFTLLTALLALFLVGAQLYGMSSVFGVMSRSAEPPRPWPWWGYQFTMRLLEIAMCVTMLYVSSQPLRYNVKVDKDASCVQQCCLFFPFHRVCCQPVFEGGYTSEELEYLETASCPPPSPVAIPRHAFLHAKLPPALATPKQQSHKLSPLLAVFTSPPKPRRESLQRRHTDCDVLHAVRVLTSTPVVRKARSQNKVSMLINDSGFLRFREEGEQGVGPDLVSTDDERSRPASRRSVTPGALSCGRPHATLDGGPPLCLYDHSAVSSGAATPVRTPTTSEHLGGSDRTSDTLGVFAFRAPSSIHLRDSIDRALNMDGCLKTSDSSNISDNLSSIRDSPDSHLGASSYAYVTGLERCSSVFGNSTTSCDMESLRGGQGEHESYSV